ncbi:hypothetical protein [Sphingomonas sp. Leaf10]|uniref:hypothetical protein n=1 Tax=Sphingomonas sp. Leaf10 TaxID=1735676 RepID=UPI0007003F92|nr:hypothetical protein [Sphingomonas sp. Leaf10]KQM41073.1 hypothetical protein ASE59_01865 [Sphingomonas sp. Leaf10]
MTAPRNPSQINPGLLARKGEARPAMRPHGTDEADDLGWNDLGETMAVPAVLQERAKLQAATAEILTLKLDADRLLRLRLAATFRNLSPEAFVLEALDRSLPSTSDISALVQRLAPDGAAKGTQ